MAQAAARSARRWRSEAATALVATARAATAAALAAALSLGGAGCGGGGSGGDGSVRGTPPATVHEFLRQYTAILCRDEVQCGSIGASEEADCVRSVGAFLERSITAPYSLDDALAQKRVAFDTAAAAKCIDAYRAHDACDFLFSFDDPSCNQALAPQVKPGGACRSSGECVGGGCDFGTSGSTGCPGTCRAFLAAGTDCSSPRDSCGKGDYCSSKTHLCTARGASGAACSPSDTLSCQTGFGCVVPSGGGDPTCQPAGGPGQPCSGVFGTCARQLYCDVSAQPPTCRKLASAGAPCHSGRECARGLGCIGSAGAATCKPWLDAGAACDPTGTPSGTTGCPGSMSCDPTTRRCLAQPVAKVGADCAAGSHACRHTTDGTQLYCDGTTKRCAEQVEVGKPCTPRSGDGEEPCAGSATCDPQTKSCSLHCGT